MGRFAGVLHTPCQLSFGRAPLIEKAGKLGMHDPQTFAAVTALLPGAKGTRLSTGLTNGANVYVLKWTAAASSSTPMLSNTLTVSASGQSLPIEQVSTASGGTKATTQLSGWGELVPASAPPAASTITSTKITH